MSYLQRTSYFRNALLVDFIYKIEILTTTKNSSVFNSIFNIILFIYFFVIDGSTFIVCSIFNINCAVIDEK